MTAPYTTPAVVAVDAADIPRAGQRGVFIACSVAGDVALRMPGGVIVVPVVVGANVLHGFEIVGRNSAGSTATCVVTALK